MQRILAAALLCAGFVSSACGQDMDLKTQQQVVFKDGKMLVVDAYERETVKLDNNAVVKIIVFQSKGVADTHSCGVLANRFVRIAGASNVVEMGAKPFAEFVAASAYFSKYRESWENIRARKKKRLNYQFGEKGGDYLILEGNREDLSLSLHTTVEGPAGKPNVVAVFSTKDLRAMSGFADSVTAAQKFIETHKFDECL